MKRIALVGAFDRDNYGDILFPVIIEEWLRKKHANFSYEYYGLVESDLRNCGGKKTRSIESLYNDKTDGIIIVGGQVLNARWSNMHLNLIDSNFLLNANKVLYKLLGPQNSNKLARFKLNGKTTFPWIISKEVSNGSKVIYNAVGGTRFSNYSSEEFTTLKRDLTASSYISVRDRLTFKNLQEIGIDRIELSPDSAIIISQLFDIDYLKTKLSIRIEELISSYKTKNKKYLCFQIGKHYSKGNEKIIAEELVRTSNMFDMSIILLPIGKAAGHEDHIALKKIKKYMNNKVEVDLILERNIYDIMYLISQSSIFIGTSLHGCITSLSYGVPCISLDSRVVKAREFLKEFSIEEQLYSISYDEIFVSVESGLTIPRQKIVSNTHKLMESVNRNFETIYQILK